MQRGDSVKLDKTRIVAAFKNMDFGEAIESDKMAIEWLQKNNVNLETPFVVESYVPPKTAKPFADLVAKYSYFKEITEEVRKNIQLIAQLEMVVRGFTYKDSIKSVNLFLEYLTFYSSKKFNKPHANQVHCIPENASLAYLGYFMGKNDCFNCCDVLSVDYKLAIVLVALKGLISKQSETYNVDFGIKIEQNAAVTGRTPVLIFSGADLDSACDNIINAAFNEQGIMPWSVNTVLVQEDIVSDVVMKLKRRLTQVKMGGSNDKQVDFSIPTLLGDHKAMFAQTLATAARKGIEVFQPKDSPLTALFIGGKVHNNNVLRDQEQRAPFLNVLAFRGIKEAAALCNNQQQTFAAGVWANDVGLVHEIVHNLNVSTVWVNTHGVFHPSVPMSLDKFEAVKDISSWPELHTFVTRSKTAQPAWAKKTLQERIQALHNAAIKVAANADKKNVVVQQMLERLFTEPVTSKVQVYGGYELKQFVEPIGTVFVDKFGDFNSNFVSAIASLVAGNAVILQLPENIDAGSAKLCSDLATAIPAVFQVLESNVLSRASPFQGCYDSNKSVWTAIGENYV